jgi:plasmid stability protein/predicted RNA binding protein YcfA (HicA-like mRNA interferase family)
MKLVSGKELARVVERYGWELLRVRGSRHIYGKSGSVVRLSIPMDGNNPPGVIRCPVEKRLWLPQIDGIVTECYRYSCKNMANLTVRDIPKAVHEALRKSAKKHHRSLNGEILEMLTYHAQRERHRQEAERMQPELDRLREELARKYPNAPDSVQIIREGRDSR